MKEKKYMSIYKPYENKINIFDRFLNYLEYLNNKYALIFGYCFLIYVLILLFIDIYSA